MTRFEPRSVIDADTGTANEPGVHHRDGGSRGSAERPGFAAWALGRTLDYVVTHLPWTWGALRTPVQQFFDSAASDWDARVQPHSLEYLAPLRAALECVECEAVRILDVGSGTGAAAFLLAERYPTADVLGVDISSAMVKRAIAKATGAGERPRFLVADIAEPAFQEIFPEGFDLVTLLNVVPFFGPLAQVVRRGGYVACAASHGSRTPSFTPTSVLARGFAREGLRTVQAGVAGAGTYYIARKC